ncbi:MAG: YfhO family protein, partial [Candidatus Eisenbacteria bacterium]
LLLFLFVSSGEGFFRAWSSLFHRGIPAERLQAAVRNVPNAQAGVLISLLLGALLVGVSELGRRRRWPLEWVAGGSLLLFFAANWRTDVDFVKPVALEDHVREDSLIRKMKEDPEIFRALSMIPNLYDNTFSIFGIEGARGFFDNRIRWYDEFSSPENLRSANILNLLNVKYVVSGPGVRHRSFVEEAVEGERALYRNLDVLPRAFLAERHEIMDRSRMIETIRDPDFDPREVVLLEEDPGFGAPKGEGEDEPLPVTWLEYSPNRLRVRVSAGRPSVLLVANPYLPYWHARVDGEEARLLRTDYAFQGVPVPAGQHEVTLFYRSGPLCAALAVSLAAAGLFIGGALLVFFRRRRGGESSE